MKYYGLDVHKMSTTYSCLNEEGRVLSRGRVSTSADGIRQVFPSGRKDVWVALEATGAWSYVYDLVEPLATGVVLVHPRRVKAIASAKVKTDAIDATTLAQLLRTGLLPACYVPPPHVRRWRELLRTRQSLVHMRTACRVRVHAFLAKEGHVSPVSDLFGRRGREWLSGRSLEARRQQLVGILLSQADSLTEGIRTVEGLLRQELGQHPPVVRLQGIPGFGFLTACALVAEVGDVERFSRARYLVSYLGLAPRVRASGGRVRTGRLTKEGPPLARGYLAQAVQGAIRCPGPYRELYLRGEERSGPQVARMAVARKLAIVAYHEWRSLSKRCYQGGSS